MTISPLPRHGSVLAGRDIDGRWLRVSSHPEAGRVVLSIWQDDVCRGTLRLVPEDVPELVRMLSASLMLYAFFTRERSAMGGMKSSPMPSMSQEPALPIVPFRT